MVSHEGSTLYITQKTHKKLMGKKLGAGKRLNVRVRGPGAKPSWGETRSSSHGVATVDNRSVSGGAASITRK